MKSLEEADAEDNHSQDKAQPQHCQIKNEGEEVVDLVPLILSLCYLLVFGQFELA
jgi:hypothetical protein